MFKRNWDGTLAPWLIIAIGLVLTGLASYSVFSSKGYQRANQQHEVEKSSYSQRESYHGGCFMLPTIEQARKCAENSPQTSRAEKRAEEDLNAQREMADWAEGVLWATLASVFVTAIGIGFVWRTLNANTAAVEQAAVANRLALENGIADRRAWVKIVPKVTRVFERDGIVHVNVFVTGENFGRTPARAVRFTSQGFRGPADNAPRPAYFTSLCRNGIDQTSVVGVILPTEVSTMGSGCTIEIPLSGLANFYPMVELARENWTPGISGISA